MMSATSRSAIAEEIRNALIDRGIPTMDAVGILESVKFALLAGEWGIADKNEED